MKLASAILNTARCLGQANILGKATGGTNNTVVFDTANINEPDASLGNGTIIGLSGLMLDKTAVLIGNSHDAHSVNFLSTAPASFAEGDLFAIITNRYPRVALVEAINTALSHLGGILQKDLTMLTVADKLEYQLPAGVYNVKRVEIAIDPVVAPPEPPEYELPNHFWMEWNGYLIFDSHAPRNTNHPMRIWYEAPHQFVSADGDPISDAIYPMRLAWTAAFYAAMTRAGYSENAEPQSKETRDLAAQMMQMEAKHPIRSISRDVRWSGWA